MKMLNDIWVIGETTSKYLLALVAKAKLMANKIDGRVCTLLMNDNDSDICIAAGADVVYLLDGLQECVDDGAIARAIGGMILEMEPSIILFLATVRNKGIAPAIAAQLGTGLTADCTDLDMDESGLLIQSRPTFGNTVIAEIICKKLRPQMATVRQGVFLDPVLDAKRSGITVHKSLIVESRIQSIGFVPSQYNRVLAESKIIVAGGKGIGSIQGFDYLQKIANNMQGCIGASRAAVDAGYAPYCWQIGQTGIVVRPRLYIAVGISGSIQHLVGMRSSDIIVAINSDANAPIFAYANYGIVGDWRNIMDTWMKLK